MSNKQLTTIVTGGPMDLAIAGWIDAKRKKSGSPKTEKAYLDTINQFRAALQYKGLDLDSLSPLPIEQYQGLSSRQVVTLTAQEYAGWSVDPEKIVKPTTHNQRLAILSSFYEYAILQDFLDYNPIKKVERAKVQQYKSSKALTSEQTAEGLSSIDLEIPRGKRDYAILSLLLATGRRVSEVAGLHWHDVQMSRDERVTLNFPALKGGKEQSDNLDASSSRALLSWLRCYYGPDLHQIAPETPLWVSLAEGGRNGKSYGQPLAIRSFTDICKRYLHTGKVHRTRHTWTKNMLDAGAPLPLIKKKLAHSSLATTGIYTEALESTDNPYIEEIARRAGIR